MRDPLLKKARDIFSTNLYLSHTVDVIEMLPKFAPIDRKPDTVWTAIPADRSR